MTIEVDIEVLSKSNISILQYIIGYFLLSKDFKKLEQLIKEIGESSFKTILSDMESKSFIHNMNTDKDFSHDNIIIRNKFIGLTKEYESEGLFDEILKLYPVKVQRPDGHMDYLRVDLKRCRRLYDNTIVKKSFKKHEKILKALKFEIEIRKKEDSLKYMRRLPKWLAMEEWKIFEERMKDSEELQDNNTYGTEIE